MLLGLGFVPRRPPGALPQAARRALQGDPRRRHRRGGQVRWAPRLEPRSRRAHHRPAPGVRLAARRDPLGHRAPRLPAQDPHRPPRTASTSCARPSGLSGYPSRAESEHDWVENSHASTILSYADGFAARPGAASRLDPPPHRRGDRRRIDDRRHGLRGPQQPGPQRPQGDHHPQRQRSVLRPHRLPPDRERGPHPPQPELHEAAGPVRTARPRRPGGRRPHRVGHGRRLRRHARDVRAAGVLRVPGRPLHGSVRRPRHRGHGAGAAPRGHLRRSDRRARPHPEGPRLPAGRGGRRAAPARQRRVRPRDRPRTARPGQAVVHAGLLRGADQGGRGAARGRRASPRRCPARPASSRSPTASRTA